MRPQVQVIRIKRQKATVTESHQKGAYTMNEKQNPQMLNETDLSDVSGGNWISWSPCSAYSIGQMVDFFYSLDNQGIQFWSGKIIGKTDTESGISYTIELNEQARQIAGTSSVSVPSHQITGAMF